MLLGFNINNFCDKIADLYSNYKLWSAIKTKNKDIINEFKANYSIPEKNIEETLIYYIDDSFDSNFKIKPAFDKKNKKRYESVDRRTQRRNSCCF